MSTTTEWVRYGDQLGYLAHPERAAPPLPAVLVIQEIWGVDAHIQDVTRRFAAAGYAALAPDLYAEHGQRPDELTPERIAELQAFMTGLPPAAWQDPQARDAEVAKLPEAKQSAIRATHTTLFAGIAAGSSGLARFVAPLLAATRYLRHEHDATRGQRVGCVGFCMGGGLSALLACNDPELSAAAVFYGSAPPLGEVARIQCPVLGLYGGLDERINAGIPALEAAMKQAGKSFEAHVYPGAMHSFFNDTRASYHVGAARDAFARTLELFRRTLS